MLLGLRARSASFVWVILNAGFAAAPAVGVGLAGSRPLPWKWSTYDPTDPTVGPAPRPLVATARLIALCTSTRGALRLTHRLSAT